MWWLDPFGAVAHWMIKVLNTMAAAFEKLVINSTKVTFTRNAVYDFLLGNTWGFALSVIVAVMVFVTAMAMVSRRYAANFGKGVVVYLLLYAGASIYIFTMIVNKMQELGMALTKWAYFYTPTTAHKQFFVFPEIVDPATFVFTQGWVLFFGWINVGIAILYVALIPMLTILVPIGMALKPAGRRGDQFLMWLISGCIVTMVVGRPVMILCVELGKWAADSILGGNVQAVHQVILIFSLIWGGLVMQPVLWVAAYVASNKVRGEVVARVHGSVKQTANHIAHPTAKGRELARERQFIRQEVTQRRQEVAARKKARRSMAVDVALGTALVGTSVVTGPVGATLGVAKSAKAVKTATYVGKGAKAAMAARNTIRKR